MVPITELEILNEATLRAIVKFLLEFSHTLDSKRSLARKEFDINFTRQRLPHHKGDGR
jgi:hypothetical protein